MARHSDPRPLRRGDNLPEPFLESLSVLFPFQGVGG